MGKFLNSVTAMAMVRQNRRLRQAVEAQTPPPAADPAAVNPAAYQAGWQAGRASGWGDGWRAGQADLIARLKAGQLRVEDL